MRRRFLVGRPWVGLGAGVEEVFRLGFSRSKEGGEWYRLIFMFDLIHM